MHNSPLLYYDQFGLSSIFGIGNFAYDAHQSSFYNNYCTDLGYSGLCDDPTSPTVRHFALENKFGLKYDALKKSTDPAFRGTGTYCINDFINDETKMNYNFLEMPKDKKIMYVNGAGNTFEDFKKNIIHLAESTKYNVNGVYCPTFGLRGDEFTYNQSRKNYIAFESTREIQKNVIAFHQSSSPAATILIMPHSRGAVYTRNALLDSSKLIRQKVEILAVAPGGYIDPHLCNRVRHIESSRDCVPYFDYAGRRRCRDTITTLKPHPDADKFDHSFTSPTFTLKTKNDVSKHI